MFFTGVASMLWALGYESLNFYNKFLQLISEPYSL